MVSEDEFKIIKDKITESGLSQKDFFTNAAMGMNIIPTLKNGKDITQALMCLSDHVNAVEECDEIKNTLKGACEILWQSLK